MRVAITISTLAQLSTNQLVGLSVAEELEKRGVSVDIYCLGRVTREQMVARLSKRLGAQIFSRRWFWATGSTIYDYPIMAALLGRPSGYDFVFEAIGPVIHLSRERTPELTYVFFPPDPDLMGDGKYLSGMPRLYSAPYRMFYRLFSANVRSTRVLAISEYIAGFCKLSWGMDTEVVYFPVPYGEWEPASPTRREGVITIGRFSPEKNQLEQIEIAQALQRAGVSSPFNIVGAAPTSLSQAIYRQLKGDAKRLGVSSVAFHPDLPRTDVIRLAKNSKVFLHTMRGEHFGIATVEAIAAGCVPIVHDSGGSREIVPFGDLRFRSTEEAAEKVRLALAGEFDGRLSGLRRHIARFSEAAFKERIADMILNNQRSRKSG